MNKNIPIFIVNFNRLNPLKLLISSLLKRKYTNIIVFDNNSTYPPLLEWYKNSPVEIYHTGFNRGPGTLDFLSREHKIKRFEDVVFNEYHVYTDSDVVPIDEIPDDFLDTMVNICKNYNIPKLGLGLKIDDLPDYFDHKQEVINHESIFTKLGHIDDKNCTIYKAPVDTTFAVNAPGEYCGYNQNAYRTGFPFLARHVPWYYSSKDLPDDEIWLRKNKLNYIGHWSSK